MFWIAASTFLFIFGATAMARHRRLDPVPVRIRNTSTTVGV